MSSLTSVCPQSLPAASRFLPSQLQSVGAAPAQERSAPPAPLGSRFPEYGEEQKVNLSTETVTQSFQVTVKSSKRMCVLRMTHLS